MDKNKILKFIGVGGVNTILSYCLYVLLALFLDYKISYALAFIFGIAISYVLSTRYVFEAKGTLKKILFFPFIYLVQYFLGLLVLHEIVEVYNVNKYLAPVLVIIILFPVTYIMSKKILLGNINEIKK